MNYIHVNMKIMQFHHATTDAMIAPIINNQ